ASCRARSSAVQAIFFWIRLMAMIPPLPHAPDRESAVCRRRNLVSRDGVRGQRILLDFFPDYDDMLAGGRPAAGSGPAAGMALLRRIRPVPQNFFYLLFRDAVFGNVLHVPIEPFVQVPPNAFNVGHVFRSQPLMNSTKG